MEKNNIPIVDIKLNFFCDDRERSNDELNLVDRIEAILGPCIDDKSFHDVFGLAGKYEKELYIYQEALINKIIEDLENKLNSNLPEKDKLEVREYLNDFMKYKDIFYKNKSYWEYKENNSEKTGLQIDNEFFGDWDKKFDFFDEYGKIEDKLKDMIIFYEKEFNK